MGKAACISALALCLLARVTNAGPATDVTTERYGYRMAVVDGISVGLVAGGVALTQLDSDVRYLGMLPFMLGTIGYLYMAPAVHMTYDRLWTARLSHVMRTVTPIAGLAIGANVVSCPADDDWCRRAKIGSAIGAGAGVLAWSLIDDLLLAKAEVPVVYVVPAPHGGALGVTGRF